MINISVLKFLFITHGSKTCIFQGWYEIFKNRKQKKMYVWHRARLQPLSSFLSLVMTICFMAILVLLHQSSRPPLQAVYQLSTLKTESVSTFIQNYFILLFLPVKDFIYIRFRRLDPVLHSAFIMWTLSATHSVDVKSQLSLWKMKPWSKSHASFKINWTVYGLWEVSLPVLWVVLLLLLLLAAAAAAGNGGCGRTVLGSPYQGVGSAASCPQVTGLMCSVHQSLAPLLSCQQVFSLR